MFAKSLPAFLILAALRSSALGQVVINEINYDPTGTDNPTEFVELYNAGPSAVDISGWKFDAGITFTFPAGSLLASHAYAVVALDVAAFQTRFGFAPYGPFTGKLSNDGEQLRLRNAGNTTIASLTYGSGFPWPTAARGAGSSMELINASLDPNLGGSWRASGQPSGAVVPRVFIPPSDVAWHYRKGTSEASNPVTAWRLTGFVEDGTWVEDQTSVGYGDSDDNTELTDMEDGYTSVFFRRKFDIAPGAMPASLKLAVRVDDGCVVWINGVEVARLHFAAGTSPLFNSLASDHEADGSVFEEIIIPNPGAFLVTGTNVIAIHAFNSSKSSSDFTLDASLDENGTTALTTAPTPGAVNSANAPTAPPAIREVANTPLQPISGQPVTITARVTDPDGMGAVTLAYQLVDPGGYLRKSDAAYGTNWTNAPMRDDGTNGDVAAGDGVYTAVLAAGLQTHRRLVRYRVAAADALGAAVTVPYADDDAPNFAYLVYNGVPSWTGALTPGATPAATYPGSLLSSLPTYHLIANSTDVSNSQYVSSSNGHQFRGTLVYEGKVYDHILFNNRGEVSTYRAGKNKWRIHFNRARDFQARDNWGRLYPATWDTLNLNACASPWVPMHRGMTGIEEALSLRLFALAGGPAPSNHFLHFRVIDDATENYAASQFSGGNPDDGAPGDLWGIYLAVEHPDGSFLDARGLPDGNVYKIESSRGDKKHQGDGQPADTSDWDQFLAACRLTSPAGSSLGTTQQTESWWRANLDLPAYYNFSAGNRILGNVDLRDGANHIFYHRPEGIWTVIPWDLDMMFIAKTHSPSNGTDRANINIAGTIDQRRALTIPALKMEYQSRARELLDLLCADASVNGGQIGQLIDEYAQFVHPSGQTLTWSDVDAAMWNQNSRTTPLHKGNFFVTPFTDSRRGGTWVRTLATPDFAGQVKFLTDYVTNTFPAGSTWVFNNGNQLGYGYQFLQADAADAAIPARPTATYSGPSGFPLNSLDFSSSAYSGGNAFAATQWRLGEISAPGIPLYDATLPRVYEVSDAWRSSALPANTAVRIPGSAVKTGHTYRARVRHQDNTGRWSAWSAPVQFVAGTAVVGPYKASLVITELMFNPLPTSAAEAAAGFTAQDFEFIELKNIGADPLDLSSVAFTAGISFAFPAGTILAPGATILVVKNLTAFNMRYGSGKPVAGAFTSGNLDNSGETLTLSLGGSSVIVSFAYSDGSHPAPPETVDPWPAPADGTGHSAVLQNPNGGLDPTLGGNWRPSRTINGSPGADDTVTYNSWAADYPGLGAITADPDTDTLDNFWEYVLSAHPMRGTSPSVTRCAIENLLVGTITQRYLTFTFRREVGALDLTYHVEFSNDLAAWAESGVRVSSIPNGDGTATEVWRSAQPVAPPNRKQWVKLRVTSP